MDQIQAFCQQQKEWLEAELLVSEATSQQEATTTSEESRSRVLTRLAISQVSVGLYGRTVIELAATTTATGDGVPRLPAHRFTSGDEVELRSAGNKKVTQGVISQVTDTSLAFAISNSGDNGNKKGTKANPKKKSGKQDSQDDEVDDSENPYGEPPFTLVPSSSVEVHRKMVVALNTLAHDGAGHAVAGPVVQALFDPFSLQQQSHNNTAESSYPESTETFRQRLSNPHLDDSQVEAIQFALQPHRVVSLIHGPPGTGKTTTVVELIRQAVRQHQWRVLVTAPSNVAVDNVLSRLVGTNSSKKKDRLRVVRLGHPARLQAAILPYSLEALVQAADGTEIVADVRKELASYLALLSHAKYETRATARREVRQLRREVRQREEGVVKQILQNAQVVLATTVGAAARILKNSPDFDLVVIDEAAQALEASCWIPILKGRRLVLAGDHCQLPPTIQSSQPAVLKGLGQTLFERLMHLYGDHLASSTSKVNDTPEPTKSTGRVSRMLKVQYRMNQRIADWASKALYGGQLMTHESVAGQTLSGILNLDETQGDDDTTDLKEPLLLIDTAGCALHEQVNAAGSRFNEGEAEIVRQHVAKLMQHGLTAPQIAVITPYNGQVETLRNMLLSEYPKLEIRSVDGFQGGERPVVVLSLVRSSARGGMDGIGFLKDDRRLNVAVTRAQRHCCVVADSETVLQSPFVKVLLEWIEEHGDTRSALEYLQDGNEAQMNSDLAAAESELSRLMVQETAKKETAKKKKDSKQESQEFSDAHKEVAKIVKDFANANAAGSELRLSAELSSRDRRLVHELAENLGIDHCSEGTDGVDRRIILSIPKPADAGETKGDANLEIAEQGNERPAEASPIEDKKEVGSADASNPSKFDLLAGSDDEDEEESEKESDLSPNTDDKTTNSPEVPMNNRLLGNLAQERARREQEKQKAAAATMTSKPNPTKSLPKQLPLKKKGKKLGVPKKAKPAEKDDGMNDLDDMAFLDSQIDKVQNSHGRKVEGRANYKSIVNGILLAKPKERETPKNTRASAALQSKLKEAQDGRKAKPKKKKK
eukprot:scaffold1341_cov178-Amphora_coffeaeformis.AAC.9